MWLCRFYSLPLSLSILENLGPVHTNQNIFFKSHPFYPEVHDSHHNRFEPLLYEGSVGVREAFVFRGHKGDFYFKTTPTVFYKCSVTKKKLTLVF